MEGCKRPNSLKLSQPDQPLTNNWNQTSRQRTKPQWTNLANRLLYVLGCDASAAGAVNKASILIKIVTAGKQCFGGRIHIASSFVVVSKLFGFVSTLVEWRLIAGSLVHWLLKSFRSHNYSLVSGVGVVRCVVCCNNMVTGHCARDVEHFVAREF